MDQQPDGFSGDGQPPRRDLQNPKSPKLKITKDSHKIKKAAAPPHRPVIIYEVDPKIHHVDDPSQFMGLVQQLTGPPVSTVTPPSQFERTRMPLDGNNSNIAQMSAQQSISAPGPGLNEPGSSMFMLPASNLSPYIGLDHHHQQYPYPDYDMTNTDIHQGSSDTNFIYSDHNFSDYFDDSLFNQQPEDEDP